MPWVVDRVEEAVSIGVTPPLELGESPIEINFLLVYKLSKEFSKWGISCGLAFT
jgi:hypothetical protein